MPNKFSIFLDECFICERPSTCHFCELCKEFYGSDIIARAKEQLKIYRAIVALDHGPYMDDDPLVTRSKKFAISRCQFMLDDDGNESEDESDNEYMPIEYEYAEEIPETEGINGILELIKESTSSSLPPFASTSPMKTYGELSKLKEDFKKKLNPWIELLEKTVGTRELGEFLFNTEIYFISVASHVDNVSSKKNDTDNLKF